MESILTSTKKLLGIAEEYDHFDPDIIMHINSVFMTLNQMGVGPTEGFKIEGEDATWNDYTAGDISIEAVKSYMAAKVRFMFDPPDRSAVMEALKSTIAELEFRLHVASDTSQSS